MVQASGGGDTGSQRQRQEEKHKRKNTFQHIYFQHDTYFLLFGFAAAKISTLFAKLKESSVKSMIEKIKETIKKNISNEDFTVSDAIKGISYSENYIRYIFSNSEGMSIKDYMIKIRMQKAFLLLKEGKPIKDVAEAAGYTNQRYFARYFKEYTGMTPSEWKASQK